MLLRFSTSSHQSGPPRGPFGLVELNHASQPDFDAGGFQVQTWYGDSSVATARSTEYRQLVKDYDKVLYTVALEVEDDRFRITLRNGRSRTWGWFAREGLSATIPRYQHDLSNYDPQVSVDNTTINVGAHRVEMLLQTETRYYSGSELVSTDTTDRVIHRFHELVQYVSLTDYELNSDDYNIEITE